jgi:hypothetical protein
MKLTDFDDWQVLRLVYLLVTYSCYDSKKTFREVLEPMIGLLDGRNDRPYPPGREPSQLYQIINYA